MMFENKPACETPVVNMDNNNIKRSQNNLELENEGQGLPIPNEAIKFQTTIKSDTCS